MVMIMKAGKVLVIVIVLMPLNIIQKTHTGSIPRLGGVSIILTTILIYLFVQI